MEEYEIMLDVVCYSEKEGASLGFGFGITKEEKENHRISDTAEIAIGISDSFWENWEEFEPGIEKVRKLIREKHFSSTKDAFFDVFGHFKLSFTIDGVEEEFEYDLDVDAFIFDLLVENCKFNVTS